MDQCGTKLCGMRRTVFRAPHDAAIDLFRESPTFELASTTPDGEPVLRTLHGVVVDGCLAFHGSPVGEKMEIEGRRAVVAVSRTVASLPSWFRDAEKACPATTLYDSAQAHGVVVRVTDPERKARVLQALMQKLQPEGRYVPIDAVNPLYRKVVASIAVMEIRLDHVDGKSKTMQQNGPAERAKVVAGLWGRGADADANAIERILAAAAPAERPAFLRGPEETTLHVALAPGDAEHAAEMLVDAYWNDDVTREEIAAAHHESSAWVGAKDPDGRLVASARALSDGAKHAWIYDVVVASTWRGRGVGDAVMRLLLEHPAVRRVRNVHLGTRDAMKFYGAMGFVEKASIARPYRTTEMVLRRPGPCASAVEDGTAAHRGGGLLATGEASSVRPVHET